MLEKKKKKKRGFSATLNENKKSSTFLIRIIIDYIKPKSDEKRGVGSPSKLSSL